MLGSITCLSLFLPITSLQTLQSHAITHSFAQRRSVISPFFNSFRTLSIATGVVPPSPFDLSLGGVLALFGQLLPPLFFFLFSISFPPLPRWAAPPFLFFPLLFPRGVSPHL